MGEADGYFNGQQRGPPQPYGQPHGQPQGYYNDSEQGYQQGFQHGYQQEPPPPYETFDQAFKVQKPKYNDVWAGILFLLFFAGYVAVSAVAINGYVHGARGGKIYGGFNFFSPDNNTIILFAFVLAVAFVLSYAYIWLARIFPKQFIWVCLIVNVCLAFGTAIFYLYKKYWSAGIVFLIFAVFYAVAAWSWIPRIPFSALMLKTTINVSKRYGHVYLVSLVGGFLAIALSAWFGVTVVSLYVRYEPSRDNPRCANGSCSKAKLIGLLVFCSFTFYWITEWLKNTLHCIVSGVYGSWYFNVHHLPRAVTRGASKRALTYSFGSISLGSLLVAIIQMLRQLCSIARSQAADNGGIGGALGYVLFCVLGCLLSLVEWAAEFINRYAFSHVALYGKKYFAAAKDTWTMIKDRGVDMLVNECLLGPVFSVCGMSVGFLTTLLSYLYLLFTKPSYNANNAFTAPILAFAFVVGLQVSLIFSTPLSSGVDAFFVAMSWDPQVLVRDHPELYSEMVRVFPRVQQAVQTR